MTLKTLCASLLLATAFSACQTEVDPAPDASADEAVGYAQPFDWPRSYEFMADGAVLIFSGTRSWRHDSGIAGGNHFWVKELGDRGNRYFTGEHPGVFTDENLSKFSVIVFNSVTGDILTEDQQAAVQRFVEGGGGLIAMHGSGDASMHEFWPWYADLIGTNFIGHPADPQFQTARVVTLAPDHAVMEGLEESFDHFEEWYSFDGPVSGEVVILAGLDESTYSPRNDVYGDVSDLSMGPEPKDHPIIWAKCPGEGRFVYSALGHGAMQFENDDHQTLLKNALAWVERSNDEEGAGCP